MLIILAIIGGIVAILTASYHLQKFGKDRYHYSIFSLGGTAVSFLGTVALVSAYSYYKHDLILNLVVAIILGLVPYILMFIRDSRKMTITLAAAALMLRFTISALFIMVILWYLFMRTDPRERSARDLR